MHLPKPPKSASRKRGFLLRVYRRPLGERDEHTALAARSCRRRTTSGVAAGADRACHSVGHGISRPHVRRPARLPAVRPHRAQAGARHAQRVSRAAAGGRGRADAEVCRRRGSAGVPGARSLVGCTPLPIGISGRWRNGGIAVPRAVFCHARQGGAGAQGVARRALGRTGPDGSCR